VADFRVFVTGSRGWADPMTVYMALELTALDAIKSGADVMVVVHGNANGADTFAHIWCDMHPAILDPLSLNRLPIVEEIHRPDWDLGNGAGFIRNDRMAKRQINLCLAFIRDQSRGATHALGCAETAGVRSRVWRV